jgi:dTDP-4-dehydrorhamnose reductase
MKILVTGANGQLGSELQLLSLIHQKFNWVFTDVDQFNLLDFKNLQNNLSKINPDLIINCAAYTNVDKAESQQDLADLLNCKAVDLLSNWTSKNKSKIIHISTDYVFDGNSNVPLNEDAATNPVNIYGNTKLQGEKACLANDPKSIVIRTSWVYSSFGKNFVKTMSSLMSKRNSLNIVKDQIGSPTYARDIAEVLIFILNHKNWYPGLYHYSNEGQVSWYEFAKLIKKYFGYNTILKGVSSNEYPTQAKRPKYSLLDKSKIKNTYNVTIPKYNLSLKKCIKVLINEK